MVKARGGAGLVTNASLLIKDAGGYLMNTQRAVFIVISLKDKVTGLMTRSHQMAYVSQQAEDVVLSREIMETFGLVKNFDDRKKASVCHLSTTAVNGGENSSVLVEEEEAPRQMGSGSHNSRKFE